MKFFFGYVMVIFFAVNFPMQGMQQGDPEDEDECRTSLLQENNILTNIPRELREIIADYAKDDIGAWEFFLYHKSFVSQAYKEQKLKNGLPFSINHALWIINKSKTCETLEDISFLRKIAMEGNVVNFWNDEAALRLLKGKSSISEHDIPQVFDDYVSNSENHANKIQDVLKNYLAQKSFDVSEGEQIQKNKFKLHVSFKKNEELINSYYHTRDIFISDFLIGKKSVVKECLAISTVCGVCSCSACLMGGGYVTTIVGCVNTQPLLIGLGLASSMLSFLPILSAVTMCWILKCESPENSSCFTPSRKTDICKFAMNNAQKQLRKKQPALQKKSQFLIFDNQF